jgi:16S rRNA (cytidine1402-2'-O)-methyltransferase
MPGISDPGADLVAACLEEGIAVVAIPGPTAVMTALVLSGLAAERFAFYGFLPSAKQARRKALEDVRARTETLILYEAPHRLEACLADMREILGDRRAAAARELTKVHEEVARGRLSALSARFAERRPRGEITLIIEGAQEAGGTPPAADLDEAVAQVRRLVSEGASLRDAARQVAAATGLSRNKLYRAGLGKRNDDEQE